MRVSERIYLVYFFYVAILAGVMRPDAAVRAALVALGTALAVWAIGRAAERQRWMATLRDWLPILYTLMAYREMDWFSPAIRDRRLENGWIGWDRLLLNEYGLRQWIESAGLLIPAYLELTYLLVYGVTAFSIGCFYGARKLDRVDRFTTVYAVGTLLSYAMFPFFPSDPPRVVFPGADNPGITTPLRDLNLFFVGNYGIHSSVFPSAHVSSAFAAAWGLILFLPERKPLGWGMLIYAASVSVATVYGRYHYAVDAAGGLTVSLAALGVALRLRRARSLT